MIKPLKIFIQGNFLSLILVNIKGTTNFERQSLHVLIICECLIRD